MNREEKVFEFGVVKIFRCHAMHFSAPKYDKPEDGIEKAGVVGDNHCAALHVFGAGVSHTVHLWTHPKGSRGACNLYKVKKEVIAFLFSCVFHGFFRRAVCQGQ